MITDELRIVVLRPTTESNWLTQAALELNEERIFSQEIYLAPTDSINNYVEVDDTYKQDYEQQQQQTRIGDKNKENLQE